jgi:divalent metal cation (Fe/Co/Zn/Cd) transporter
MITRTPGPLHIPMRGIVITRRGLRAIHWSCAGLLVTAFLQLVVVLLSGGVALLADSLDTRRGLD